MDWVRVCLEWEKSEWRWISFTSSSTNERAPKSLRLLNPILLGENPQQASDHEYSVILKSAPYDYVGQEGARCHDCHTLPGVI